MVIEPYTKRAIFERAVEVSLLGALAELYEPLQAREKLGEKEAEPVEKIGFFSPGIDTAKIAKLVHAIEEGRRLAKDIGGADCERMTPKRVAEYVLEAFKNSNVKVTVQEGDILLKEYPLLSAVARASMSVERHHPCVIRLDYSSGNI